MIVQHRVDAMEPQDQLLSNVSSPRSSRGCGRHADLNLDLCHIGADGMRARLADQLVPSDRMRILPDTRRADPRR
jgi:hypothetical protein